MAGLFLVIGREQVYMPAGSAGISSRWRRLGQSKRLCTACGRGPPSAQKICPGSPIRGRVERGQVIRGRCVPKPGDGRGGGGGGEGGNNRYLGPMG